MHMLILDVETTGTEAYKHSLVSIGAVDFLNSSRTFYEECRIWDGAHVSPEALAVNGYTEDQIRDPKKQSEGEAVAKFLEWMKESVDHNIAGQNVFFDTAFIIAAAIRNRIDFSIPHRIIDQHSICYAHMIKQGIEPPMKNKRTDLNSDKIMEYVGIPAEPKPHIAINGAIWEAEAFSRLLHNKNLLPQFSQYSIPW